MEFPHNHHHHHHHDPEDDERRERPPPYYSQPPSFGQPQPPPSFFQPPAPPYNRENEYAPPPPPRPGPYYQESHVSHVSHVSDYPEGLGSFNYQQPPPPPRPNYPGSHVSHVSHVSDHPEGFGSFNYQQPPPPGRPEPAVTVTHVAHEENETAHHHSFKPHLPSIFHHHTASGSAFLSHLSGKPTVRVFSKAEPNFSLTIRDGKVILARSHSDDEFQHWYKDEKYSTRVKDEEGFPSFALVNKATGLAMKHSIGDTHPVQLIPYNPDVLDESILWTESKDTGDDYRAIRMVNNIRLNVDAFHGDQKSGGVHDGTTIVLWKWNKGENQRWKIIRYCKFSSYKTQK